MPFRSRNIARELAAAIAVMAVYILVLLAPLHQAAGLQRDLAGLGYATAEGWSVCASLASQNQDGKPAAIVKCAAAGIGKHDLVGIEPVAIDVAIVRSSVTVRYAASHLLSAVERAGSSGQPRAPPTA